MSNYCILESISINVLIGLIKAKACQIGLHEIIIENVNRVVIEDLTSVFLYPNDQINSELGSSLQSLTHTIQFFKNYFTANESSKSNKPSICWKHICKTSFEEDVLKCLLCETTFGQRISYKELAALSGHENAYRAVGGVMKKNPICILIPCHRVVKHNQKIGNYSGGENVKQWLLEFERKRI